ncbi:MAG: RNA-binding protein [Pseudomonadota bacterium]
MREASSQPVETRKRDNDMNERKCIVTGKSGEADELMRFVAGPDGQVVPDIRRKLPGRGCWVTATRDHVAEAVAKKAFARGLKTKVSVAETLADDIDGLLAKAAEQSLAMARKAGDAVSGSMQVDKAVRAGRALAAVHAVEAAPDGIRKVDQARKATVHFGGPKTLAFRLLTTEQMSFAFGGGNVIHAAVLDGGAGTAALRRLGELARYRGNDGMIDAAR